ncbi:MAG: nuclease [Deltaproteobacteria bacterium]|nr:nuclease [Deltaproteobacteria bacterium]
MAPSLKKYILCALILSLAVAARAETWQGTCAAVLDGDSLVVMHEGGKKQIRLYGIDTPEFDQPFGKQARACTRDLVLQKKVTVEPIEIDKYGRTVAKVHTAEGCLNELLLERGCAWVYRRYCKANDLKAWTALEQSARLQGLGLWSQSDPVPPWKYRSTGRMPDHKQVKKSGEVTGYYRGNTGSRVFHAPGCTAYACKNCTAGFNSLGAALRAGYKPCKKCIDTR